MKRFFLLLSTVTFAWSLLVDVVYAQATRTWVSGVGDDVNPCSRTAPCKTFAGAISKTAASGEINTLDPGGFGAVTITKSITIRSDGVEAGVLVSSGNGIIINAGATDNIVLYGLDINGVGTGANGINIANAGSVLISHCTIKGFLSSPSSAGVLINSLSNTKVTIDHCTIDENALGVAIISANGSSRARLFDNLVLNSSTAGVRVSGSGNDAMLLNNRIINNPKSLDLQFGGSVTSFGGNVLPTGDLPTTNGILR